MIALQVQPNQQKYSMLVVTGVRGGLVCVLAQGLSGAHRKAFCPAFMWASFFPLKRQARTTVHLVALFIYDVFTEVAGRLMTSVCILEAKTGAFCTCVHGLESST